MKAIFVSLALLCGAIGLDARNINVPFVNVTSITSFEPVGKYTIEFIHPSTKKRTVAPICMADYRKLMLATFNRSYTVRCIFTGKDIKVTLIKKATSK